MIVSRSRAGSGAAGTTSSPGAERFGAALRRASDAAASATHGRRAAAQRRGGASGDAAAQRPSSGGAPPSGAGTLLQQPRAPERSELAAPASVHRVAIAVEVLRTGDRARLELGFHDGAALRLDATPSGVALTLAVAPALSRVAAAELPALVAALKQRGVEVARADLRVVPERRAGGRRPR